MVLFVAAFGTSGLAIWLTLSEPVDASIEGQLVREADRLARLYGSKPPAVALDLIRERERRTTTFQWRLGASDGRRFDGDLVEASYRPGFLTVATPDPTTSAVEEGGPPDDDDADATNRLRTYTAVLPNGTLLTVGEDLGRTHELKRLFLRTFILASGAALIIALSLALTFVSRILGRIEVIAATADAVSGQDMGARAPVRDPVRADDIDRLALSVNRMLDRIAAPPGQPATGVGRCGARSPHAPGPP